MYSILLVDDDFFALEGMKRGVHFQELGFENVYYCTSMASACKVLEQHPVDVLVTDIEMPGGSGLDLQKWVLAKGIKLVTIFLTCHASFEYAQDAIRLHIFDYILKPLRYADFEKKLSLALRESPGWEKPEGAEAAAPPAVDSDAPVSVTSYIRNRRIKIAQRLLKETNRSIDEISQAVGYSYNTYFFNIFKEVTGVSPYQYRKSKEG